MTFLAVLPVIWAETAVPCIESMLAPGSSLGLLPEEILVIDNSREGLAAYWSGQYGVSVHRDKDGHNLGVAGSWNIGARAVIDRDLDWFVILSSSMIFGPELHTTFRREIEDNAVWHGEPSQIVECYGNSWHCIAIARRTLEQVGVFDPNYYPAYEEAIDWGYRQKLLGLEDLGWPRVWCNAMSIGHAVHVDQSRWGAPSCPSAPLLVYYEAKWGGPKGSEKFTTPWDVPGAPLDEWPNYTIPELARLYGLECWW